MTTYLLIYCRIPLFVLEGCEGVRPTNVGLTGCATGVLVLWSDYVHSCSDLSVTIGFECRSRDSGSYSLRTLHYDRDQG